MSEVKKNPVKPVTVQSKPTGENEVFIISEKRPAFEAFHFKGFENLGNLIAFLGRAPMLNADKSIQVKKWRITEGSYIVRDSAGNISGVLSNLDNYTVHTSEPFNEKFARKVEEKPVKEKPTKEAKVKK